MRRNVRAKLSCSAGANRTSVRTFKWLLFAMVAVASTPSAAWGQYWNPASAGIYYNGPVGIGTASPGGTLDVLGTNSAANLTVRSPSGNMQLYAFSDGKNYFESANSGFTASQPLYFTGPGASAGTFAFNGSVGIGTTNPQYLLTVNGTIGAKDIIVTNSITGWPDYVFRPGYQLKSLSEVNTYIQQNHHLPDFPTEAEVKERGVSLGEMQSKLLAKVEELTLHMILAEERNDRLELQNRELQQQNREIQESIAHMKTLASSLPGAGVSEVKQ